MAVFRVERTGDYTVMSNFHLKDKRLSLKAKGLLSQMLSLPDDWDYTLSGLSYINRESKDAIRSAVNELETAGYIRRRQTTDASGKFAANEYTIFERPIEGEPMLDKPLSENPITVNPSAVNPLPENPTQLNTKKSNTQKSITYPSSTHSFVPSPPAAEGRTEGKNDILAEREKIREQIEYEYVCTPYNREQVDEFVELMLEVALSRSPTMKIGRDAEYPTAFVQERFSQLTSSHIEKVLDGIKDNTTRVWNTRAYLLAALFNAPATTDNHYTMLVNHDFHHDGG